MGSTWKVEVLTELRRIGESVDEIRKELERRRTGEEWNGQSSEEAKDVDIGKGEDDTEEEAVEREKKGGKNKSEDKSGVPKRDKKEQGGRDEKGDNEEKTKRKKRKMLYRLRRKEKRS
ncbi:nucleolar protein 58-like [Osmia bicornis bicornis]|uniref:nucleolar protein 58-like n=1 Tax=Osmia bicornis bicornis TaxID=1437191 RepID=UPI0010F8F86A|nr:nucleolar protein 58-like [Osmia bicornis bicornis]